MIDALLKSTQQRAGERNRLGPSKPTTVSAQRKQTYEEKETFELSIWFGAGKGSKLMRLDVIRSRALVIGVTEN